MADPVIPGGIRAQVVVPGRSGLPEDHFVTTWAFKTLDGLPPAQDDIDEVQGRLIQFVSTVAPGANYSPGLYLGSQCDKTAAEVRCYRLGDTPPREPFVEAFSAGVNSTGDSLPSEVAVCMSFFSERNLPRRRGRVYWGPLIFGQSIAYTDAEVAVPSFQMLTDLGLSCKRLADGNNLTQWGVLSQVNQEIVPITDGWIDNAFDTQRRRGEAATARSPWTAA